LENDIKKSPEKKEKKPALSGADPGAVTSEETSTEARQKTIETNCELRRR
jgi:hypothetical protein